MRRLIVLAAGLLALAATPAAAAPCATAAKACEQWLSLGPGARGMTYSTYSFSGRNPGVTRALIMVHGTLRNADHYFTTATGAAFLAKALGDTVVIAPAFHSAAKGCDDKLEAHEVSWSCSGDSWRSGGAAASDPKLTSFDFMDALLTRLADRKAFPNLKTIVVAGHSAGGQFVARYAMANRVDGTLAVPISYVVANPSSYAWPDATRPLPKGDGAPANAAAAWNEETPHTDYSYGPFDAAKAPDYDRWPFGLEARTAGYTAKMSDAQLKRQLASRDITYLFGQVDVLPLGGFDDSPGAMAQGPTRRARGEAYVKYIAATLGAKPKVMIVPECGHNDRCVYTTDTVLPVIFPTTTSKVRPKPRP